MDRGTWWATVHGATKESDMTEQLTLSLSCICITELYCGTPGTHTTSLIKYTPIANKN